MNEHIACMTFDFDAMSGFVSRGMTSPTPVSRGEFGAVGVPRILTLLAERKILATWFIPGVVIETYPNLCKRIADAGHEIGHHGWTHDTPASMTRAEEHDALRRGNKSIENVSGQRARGYRSPAWDLSPHSIELLLDEGFVYDSSMMGHDYLPYRARVGDVVDTEGPMQFGKTTSLLEMPISWSLDDYPHFEFVRTGAAILPGLANASAVLENWIADYRYLRQRLDYGIITYTFHPLVIGRGHRLLALEALIDTLSEEGATFTTLEQAGARAVERDWLAEQPD
jgi:peptidoglycan/xylan/chitin deacetylase (PgdA/CDA1 family)